MNAKKWAFNKWERLIRQSHLDFPVQNVCCMSVIHCGHMPLLLFILR